MKVKLQTLYANANMSAGIGSTIDVSDEEAAALIAGRFAHPAEGTAHVAKPAAPVVETAEAAPAFETAEAPHAHPAKEHRISRRR